VSTEPGPGPRQSLHALGADVLALVRLRLELLSVELNDLSQRHKEILQLAVVSALFLAAGLLAVAVLVIVLFWDSYRVAAIVAVCVAYLGTGAWAFVRLRDLLQNSPPPFGATLSEFERDLDMLRGGE
jgi:uncharacterized membrane protein YqjE